MTRDEALKILDELGNSPNMIKHGLAAGYVMRSLCQYLSSRPSQPSQPSEPSEPFNPDDWEIVGLLHDADYEITDKSLEKHTEETTKKLKEKNVKGEIIDAIRGHCDKAERKTLMAKSIYACDELTGLIVAAALVQPDKKLESVTVESVLRKFKDKSFAAGANREQINTCDTELKINLEKFVSIVLAAMQTNSGDLGL